MFKLKMFKWDTLHKKRTITYTMAVLLMLGLSACGDSSSQNNSETSEIIENTEEKTEEKTDSDNIKIVVSFNAMAEFANVVGQDKVEITTIVPDGVEAHDFEPKAKDLEALNNADIFIYNGLDMESWVEEALSAIQNSDLIVVNASEGADLILSEEISETQEEEESEETQEHTHGVYDPHLWLGIRGAQTQAENVKNALVEADPANATYYEKHWNEFAGQLETLYKEYADKFAAVEHKSFVTGHAAFAYLCRDFGLEQKSVMNIYAEGEPSAKQLVELVEYCLEYDVTTIFSEELASPAVSQTLADEVGARVETIYSMEGTEDNKTYLERMEGNLEKIYESFIR